MSVRKSNGSGTVRMIIDLVAMKFGTGRYDIARALEKWGGVHEVSRLLSLKVRQRSRHEKVGKDKRSDHGHAEGEMKTPCISQDTQKWLTKLKQLDINWFE